MRPITFAHIFLSLLMTLTRSAEDTFLAPRELAMAKKCYLSVNALGR